MEAADGDEAKDTGPQLQNSVRKSQSIYFRSVVQQQNEENLYAITFMFVSNVHLLIRQAHARNSNIL